MRKKLTAALLLACLCGALLSTAARADDGFEDVALGSFCADAVAWAAGEGITAGTWENLFSPDEVCTRGQVMTFLWRAKGRPTPARRASPFRDVGPADYFYEAVLWAVEQGVTVGTAPTAFSPDAPCLGKEIVTFLYRALYGVEDSRAGEPYYARALAWVEEKALDVGMDFDPEAPCTRAMTVTFLYRDAGEPLWRATIWVDGEPRPGLGKGEQLYLVDDDGVPVPVEGLGRRCVTDPERYQAFLTTAPAVDLSALAGRRVPILMYHAVSDDVWGEESLFVSPDSFRAQLEYLAENGYETLFFSDLAHIEDYEKPVLLTFDDGYRDNYEALYPLLREYGAKATVFIITNTIYSELHLTPAQIREMAASGLVDIQSHTADHYELKRLTGEEQRAQMARSSLGVARLTKRIPYVLAYPNGSHDQTTKRLCPEYYDFGVRDGGGAWRSGADRCAVTRIRISSYTDPDTFAGLLR